MKKIRVKLSSDYENYTLAQDISKDKTLKLLNADIVLSIDTIERLLRHGVNYVYVYQKEEDNAE